MASPSYTYTLTNGTTADASQVTQNFNDILNGVTDGTKDLSISALTCAGTATLNGNVNLGNSSSDDLSITASLATSIAVKTNASYDFGAATLGLRSVYLGNASSYTVRLLASASQSATYTLTLPTAAPSASGYVMSFTSAGVASFVQPKQDSPKDADNYTIACSVGSSALTIALKTKAGSDPASGDPVRISFRSATAATGDYTVVETTAATSVVVSSGSTLGHVSAEPMYFYVYALNNSGTIELAVSTKLFDDGSVQTTTAEGGAGAADSATTLYSTTARTSKAIRLLARLSSTQTTAGTWAAVPTEISLGRSFVTPATITVPNNAVDYAANTRMGLMVYAHGTTYSGGNAPTITTTSGGSLSSVTRSCFIPYQVADGTWRLRYSFKVAVGSGARTLQRMNVAGVTTKNVSSWTQPGVGLTTNLGTNVGVSYWEINSGDVNCEHASNTVSAYAFSGDIELESKPTWAY